VKDIRQQKKRNLGNNLTRALSGFSNQGRYWLPGKTLFVLPLTVKGCIF